MATPAKHVSTYVQQGPTCVPPTAGLLFLGHRPPSPTPRGHVCAGSAPGTARGRARPPTLQRQRVAASAGAGPAGASSSGQMSPPTAVVVPLAPVAGLHSGGRRGREPPRGHSPRALPPPPPLSPPRRDARPASPKRGGASARRRARSAPGPRPARGLRLPLPAAAATAPGGPQPSAKPSP